MDYRAFLVAQKFVLNQDLCDENNLGRANLEVSRNSFFRFQENLINAMKIIIKFSAKNKN